MSQVRSPYVIGQPIVDGYSSVRVSITYSQGALEGFSKVRANFLVSQPLLEGYSVVRCSTIVFEVLFPVPEALNVSTLIFPGFGNSLSDHTVPQAKDPSSGLPGIAYSIHKIPAFKTKISEAASGFEIRNSLTRMPRWEFDLPYEFLEDHSGLASSLRTLMGFFLEMRGSFDSCLVKDPDDYLSNGGICGIADGGTLQFPLTRAMGGFNETVGQVDMANTITVSHTIDETDAVPAGPGPYTITVANAGTFAADAGVKIGGTALTKVTGAPAAMQYAVNVGTGVYTFNAAQASASAVISYRYGVTGGWSITLPNQLVFAVAPAAGTVISADFQFFFACRFLDDQMDFEKFMNQIWAVGKVSLRSILQ